MDLYCPYCSGPITPGTTKCPHCDHIYSSDTLSFINLPQKGQEEYTHEKRKLSQKGQEESTHEKRKHTRVPIKLKAVFVSPQDFVDRYIFDLSTGGLFVESKTALKRGEKVDLKISFLDKSKPMEISCEVMWCRKSIERKPRGELPPGMGLKFLELSRENKERIVDILSRSLT